ncbi:GIY-YIG nuclease family protein [Rothia nasimurium]|uniref:GIY-YIG nuclease family protein n=1 Tax=Rothia nasimurium TaxID=85336 RepID=UPI001F3F8D73|nr:GIY-YIG nuclease family protein [Rothia nasimurium]
MSYYVYGIVDPTEVDLAQAPSKEEQLGAVIYVGKGTGRRMDQHLKDAQYLLEYSPDSLSVAGRKLNRLAELLQAGTPPKAIKLMAGFESEVDAYRAEAFAIEAVNAIRMSMGRPLLTNAVKGHGVAMEDFNSFMDRFDVEDYITDFSYSTQSILVKIGTEDFRQYENIESVLSESVRRKITESSMAKIVARDYGEVLDVDRRGYDINSPWSDDEARARCARYWMLGAENVASWIDNPETMPKYLLANVEDTIGSVVRYVWEIDPDGMWESYPDSKWGVPLGDRVIEHRLLNKVIKNNNGRRIMNSPVKVDYI